jgi:hypothetical protein
MIMKRQMLRSSLILFIFLIFSLLGHAQIRKVFRGSWNFDAPSAPQGYQAGVITITKDSVFTKYSGNLNLYPSSFISFKNDTLKFVFNPAVDVTITLTSKSKTKLVGLATWMSEESVLTLTRINSQNPQKVKGK